MNGVHIYTNLIFWPKTWKLDSTAIVRPEYNTSATACRSRPVYLYFRFWNERRLSHGVRTNFADFRAHVTGQLKFSRNKLVIFFVVIIIVLGFDHQRETDEARCRRRNGFYPLQ